MEGEDQATGTPSGGGRRATRRLAAIMFADMVGYTALMQEDERQATVNRDRTRTVLRREVAANGGEIVQYYGDGALSIFGSAIKAVESGIAIQAALTSGAPIPVRIGIHTGDVVHDEEGAFGDGVNVASRIESLCAPGGLLVSGKVFDEVKNQPTIETKALGEFALKNVKQRVSVYAILNGGMTVPNVDAMPFRAGTDEVSVAVLPFVNMSAEPEKEYFSDGVSEELINLLTRINGLKVTARTSSFSFKGRNVDVRQIGRELAVGHVLEGSVRSSGNRVRITAQLVSTDDGYHLFSNTYDRTVDDVFEAQDELAAAIIAAVADRLGRAHESEGKLQSQGITKEAHDEYLRGLFHWAKWTPEGARAAIVHYRRALEIDPTAALPHSGLAMTYGYLGFLGQAPFEESHPVARAHAERALELDDRLGEAHVALGLSTLFGQWDFEGAYAHFQKALSLNPGAANVHHLYAIYLLAAGDVEGAVEEMETAVALDPLSLLMLDNLGLAYSAAGRREDAARALDRVLSVDPHFRSAIETRAWLFVSQGRLDDAAREFEGLRILLGDPLKGVASLGYVYAKQGREEEALQMLKHLEERAKRDPGVSLELDFAILNLG
ncbi:MAG: adenylate/guanylate cyclase domain-containing protein, partial [Longimicrobiales bacterium]